MSKVMLELHEFFIEGGDQKRSHVLLHIAEPSNPLEEEKGYFFALAEINNGEIEQIEHLQQMIDDLESGYYETDDQEEKDSFELTLEYINRRGHHVLQNKHSVLNCIVGAIRKNEISFSYHGRPAIKMVYGKPSNSGRQEKFELADLVGSEEEKKEDQLFSAIMQGKLKDGDFFYIATPHVEDNISNTQIINTLSARTPKQSATYIEKILSSIHGDMSFGGIIFHFPPQQQDNAIFKKPNITQIKSEPSHNSPPVSAQNKPAKKINPEAETNYRPRGEYEKEPLVNIVLITIGRSLVTGAIALGNLFKKVLITIGRIIVALVLLATNKGGQRSMVIQSFNESIAKKKTFIRELPMISKILFVLTLLLAVIFIGSISYLRLKENLEAKRQDYKNQVQAIMDKKTAAESSMIYNDDDKAFILLKEANALLDSLPSRSQDQKDEKDELKNEIEASLKILQKLNTVTPELVADLAQIQSSAQTTELVLVNNEIISYGPDDLFLYKLNLDTNKIEKKEHQSIPNLMAANTPKEQDKIVFLTKENGLAEYRPESGTLSAREFPITANANINALFVYNQKLYTIDTANNQVYKHNPTQTGYDKGSPWAENDGVDFSDGVSLAIDGDLFLLKSNGEILKFVSGRKEAFAITGLDPGLNNPIKIWTYNNVKNLYILEPTNKRVIVLDKQGKLLQQYTAVEWQNPTGMVVNEDNKVIYILDNNKIYRIGIE